MDTQTKIAHEKNIRCPNVKWMGYDYSRHTTIDGGSGGGVNETIICEKLLHDMANDSAYRWEGQTFIWIISPTFLH